jgi:hypothetical protein
LLEKLLEKWTFLSIFLFESWRNEMFKSYRRGEELYPKIKDLD